MLIQKNLLKIARPNGYFDNIGFHKDTIYGQSPYEMSIHLPLVNLNKKSCLKVVKDLNFLKKKILNLKNIPPILKKVAKVIN